MYLSFIYCTGPSYLFTRHTHAHQHMDQEPLYVHVSTLDLGHTSYANEVKVLPDGTTIATCLADATIRIFDFVLGTLQTVLKGHTRGINCIEYLPIDSDIIVLGLDDLTVRFWLISKSKCIKILKKHTYHVTSLKFVSKGNVLVTGSADENITIWDLTSGKTLRTLAAHSDPISLICLTPDNTIIVSGGYDGIMRLFDLEHGQCLKTLTVNSSHGTATASTADVINHPITNVIVSPNGKYIFLSSLDGYIRLWEYMNNKVCKTYGDGTIALKYCCAAALVTVTPEPLVVLGSEDQGLLVFNVQTRQTVYNYPHSDVVMGVAVHQNYVVGLGMDGKIIKLRLRDDAMAVLSPTDGTMLPLASISREPTVEYGAERRAELETRDETPNGEADGDIEMKE